MSSDMIIKHIINKDVETLRSLMLYYDTSIDEDLIIYNAIITADIEILKVLESYYDFTSNVYLLLYGNEDMIRRYINKRNCERFIDYAIEINNVEAIQLMIDMDYVIGDTNIRNIAKLGHIELMKCIVDNKISIHDDVIRYAVYHDQFDMVKFLVEEAKVKVCGIEEATRKNYKHILNYLIDHGAQITKK